MLTEKRRGCPFADMEIFMAKERKKAVAYADTPDEETRASLQTELREALLLAGIAELEVHGVGGFSLRRVAAACGVSCAAPYKHFESKEAFIAAILAYIHEKWELLESHICTAFPRSGDSRLVELCLADIRFWLGNPHFYTVHMLERKQIEGGATRLGSRAEEELKALCLARGADYERSAYLLRSLVYGAILMLEDGTLPNEAETFRMLRAAVTDAIPKEKA